MVSKLPIRKVTIAFTAIPIRLIFVISSFGSVKFHPISAQSTKSQNFILRQHIQQIFDLPKFYLRHAIRNLGGANIYYLS